MQRLVWLMLVAGIVFNYGCQADASKEEASSTTNEGMAAEKASESANTTAATILNPNLASKEELLALSQIDEDLAQQIIDNRPFLNVKDFHQLLLGTLDEGSMETFLSVCFVPLNLNMASKEEFLMVPGVGEKMAHEFEEYRPYKKVAQFRREMGKYVNDAEIARYEKYVFVPLELNSATDEEMLGIPGVGDRLLHEFKEYRPYKSIEQFRREIGKYVDDKELARLERFFHLDMEN